MFAPRLIDLRGSIVSRRGAVPMRRSD